MTFYIELVKLVANVTKQSWFGVPSSGRRT